MSTASQQGFSNNMKVWQQEFTPVKGEWEILLGRIFLLGGGNLRSDFDHSNLFQS